jgi:hypothetical protein
MESQALSSEGRPKVWSSRSILPEQVERRVLVIRQSGAYPGSTSLDLLTAERRSASPRR